MDTLAVMTEAVGRLDGVGGIRPFPTPPDSAAPPFACCGAPETSTFRLTSNALGNGLTRLTLPLMVAVAGVSDRNLWTTAMGFTSTSGPTSVIAALEDPDEYTAFDTLAVLGWEVGQFTMEGVGIMAVTFNVDIVGR